MFGRYWLAEKLVGDTHHLRWPGLGSSAGDKLQRRFRSDGWLDDWGVFAVNIWCVPGELAYFRL